MNFILAQTGPHFFRFGRARRRAAHTLVPYTSYRRTRSANEPAAAAVAVNEPDAREKFLNPKILARQKRLRRRRRRYRRPPSESILTRGGGGVGRRGVYRRRRRRGVRDRKTVRRISALEPGPRRVWRGE